jgi:hypothetical protein
MATANVVVSLTANPDVEQISLYHFFQDGTEMGTSATPTFTIPGVTPGAHSYTVAAANAWGLGPQSAPVLAPPAASQCQGVTITINITV